MPVAKPDIRPDWLKPKGESVLDSPARKAIRTALKVVGLSEPQDQLFAVMNPLEPVGQVMKGPAQKALEVALEKGKGLYSRVEKVVSGLGNAPMHPNKVAGMLKNQASPDETAYRGVDKFLAAAGNKPISKQALEQVLKDNPLNLKTTSLGKPGSTFTRQITPTETDDRVLGPGRQIFQVENVEDPSHYTRIFQLTTPEGETVFRANGIDYPSLEEAKDVINQAILNGSYQKPQYQQYSLPGDKHMGPQKNYRENLTQLVPNDPLMKEKFEFFPHSSDELYHAPHFRSSAKNPVNTNLLAHSRTDDRTLPSGEKIRFLEEAQSDLHQAGKQHGYATPESKLANQQAEKDALDKFHAHGKKLSNNSDILAGTTIGDLDNLTFHDNWLKERDRLYNEYMKAKYAGEHMVPDAPFKEAWPDLLLKQQLVEIADSPDLQGIGFTSGDVQNNRYNLAKQIQNLRYFPTTKELIGSKDGINVIHETVEPEQLADYIGQGRTKQLLSSPAPSTDEGAFYQISLDPNDRIGGEGMEHFYDNLLPKRLQKILAPFGKVDVVPQGLGVPDPHSTSNIDETLNLLGMGNPPVQEAMGWVARLSPEIKERIRKEGLPYLAMLMALRNGQPQSPSSQPATNEATAIQNVLSAK